MPMAQRWDAELLSWLVFKLILGLGWTHAMLLVTPASIASAVTTDSVNAWTLGTAAGAVVSILGMILTTSRSLVRVIRGFTIELVGIVLLVGGPIQYLGVQIGFLFQDHEGFTGRYPLAWFAAVPIIAIAARTAQIVRRRRRARTALLLLPQEA